ncbi:NUDIX domain-containing protein [Amycolatopsis sp. cg9]|uniref:NUDIX hydrolase n=1 Tax=Amycolatopsis sp. cg9 TaxID=3238801 RepID=UPI0035235942
MRIQELPLCAVAVDLAILTVREQTLQALVIERATPPHQGVAALPGGFLLAGETLDDAAHRKLTQETGLDVTHLHIRQLHAYSDPGRDPRGRIVSVLYVALLPDLPLPAAGGGAATATWRPAEELLAQPDELAFDHHQMLGDAVEHARDSLSDTTVATTFCPPEFTIAELRTVYEVIWGTRLDPSNFHRKVTRAEDFLIPTGKKTATDGGRPAALFRAGPATRLHPALQRERHPKTP